MEFSELKISSSMIESTAHNPPKTFVWFTFCWPSESQTPRIIDTTVKFVQLVLQMSSMNVNESDRPICELEKINSQTLHISVKSLKLNLFTILGSSTTFIILYLCQFLQKYFSLSVSLDYIGNVSNDYIMLNKVKSSMCYICLYIYKMRH